MAGPLAGVGRPRSVLPAVLALLIVTVAGACTAGSPDGVRTTPRSSSVAPPVTPASTMPASVSGSASSVRAVLERRPLHLPSLGNGQRCPTSRGTTLNITVFGHVVAHGTGLVRPLGGRKDGVVYLIDYTFAPGWLASKQPWVSDPSYDGPFLIRLARLDGPGPVGLDEHPGSTSLYRPAGPTASSSDGYRIVTGSTWVKKPGCVAWQVDGLNFSDVIVARLVCKPPACHPARLRSRP